MTLKDAKGQRKEIARPLSDPYFLIFTTKGPELKLEKITNNSSGSLTWPAAQVTSQDGDYTCLNSNPTANTEQM